MTNNIVQNMQLFIEDKCTVSKKTAGTLSLILNGLLDHVCINLRDSHDKQNVNRAIRPFDVNSALQTMKFRSLFIDNLHFQYLDFLKKEKSKKIDALRENGYGATNEHVQFIAHILANPHKCYEHQDDVPPETLSVEDSDAYYE